MTVLLVGVVGMAVSACGRLAWPSLTPSSRSTASQAEQGESSPSAPASVVVQRGDTVHGIARRYRLPVRALIVANKLSPPYTLRPGQNLTLPPSKFHVVQQGDTVTNIARRYRVEAPALIRANDIKPPYVIVLGQSLSIPNAKATVSSSSSSPPPSSSGGAPEKAEEIRPSPPSSAPPSSAREQESPPSPFIPKPPPRSGQAFLWPVTGKVVTRFGSLGDGLQNDGINIAVDKGTPVRAADNGVVVYVGNEMKGFGNLLLIKHAEGWMTAYAHQEAVTVKRGQKVSRGETVGRVGSTGSAPFPQLHFEVRRGTKAVDPMSYLANGSA